MPVYKQEDKSSFENIRTEVADINVVKIRKTLASKANFSNSIAPHMLQSMPPKDFRHHRALSII